MTIDPARLRAAYETARDQLLAERDRSGHWIGELSASALSTATAASALAVVLRLGDEQYPRAQLQFQIDRAVEWIARHQNPDGGWGDTDKSLSNIATTMLVRAAFHLAGVADRYAEELGRAERYIEAQGGIAGLRRRYGKDKTFAVPILTNCALAGLVSWREVPRLPFELACLPHRLLGMLRIPVVSYAIPALVAIGQARHLHGRPPNPITRLVRDLMLERSLAIVERMQPDSGGFLEATPLTSFVVMSLAATGRAGHPVVRRGVEFLLRSVRDEGAWPIDTNLATWVTTLAINALASAGENVASAGCLDWLLGCQHRRVHPFTGAEPGGWGWTDLSGAVPDADDTAGALLALAHLRDGTSVQSRAALDLAALQGVLWLRGLQNRDGGWPTFSRGWGALPFDRSGVDLTAHALRALHRWRDLAAASLPASFTMFDGTHDDLVRIFRAGLTKTIARGLAYLARHQRLDGSWVPLWFGNQYEPGEENRVYGTARALQAYRDLDLMDADPARRGLAWLVAHQAADGSWGGCAGDGKGPPGAVSSVEETALAVEALLPARSHASVQHALNKGLTWLVETVERGAHRVASPIGLYFAKLWYYERLYPHVFTVSALGRALSGL
ncbi:MAG: squalene--hopene cyclase [Thermoguttaceae bacterium]|nr:squalene--hopene cyclase [Thermoguttaceae bacterium]